MFLACFAIASNQFCGVIGLELEEGKGVEKLCWNLKQGSQSQWSYLTRKLLDSQNLECIYIQKDVIQWTVAHGFSKNQST